MARTHDQGVPPPTPADFQQEAKTPPWSRVHGGVGAACRNRTDDLVITSDSLYRLS